MRPVTKAALALGAALVASCGGTPVVATPSGPPSPTPTAAATPAPQTSTPTPAPVLVASPTPRPSPLVSAKGTIIVSEPLRGDMVISPLTIAGDASVFEATLAWRIVTGGGTVIAQGVTQASAGAPQRGAFKAQVTFDAPYYGESGFVEVFERSAKDGAIGDIVRVPVGIQGSY